MKNNRKITFTECWKNRPKNRKIIKNRYRDSVPRASRGGVSESTSMAGGILPHLYPRQTLVFRRKIWLHIFLRHFGKYSSISEWAIEMLSKMINSMNCNDSWLTSKRVSVESSVVETAAAPQTTLQFGSEGRLRWGFEKCSAVRSVFFGSKLTCTCKNI